MRQAWLESKLESAGDFFASLQRRYQYGPIVLVTGLLALLPGCGLLHAPEKVVTAVVPGSKPSQPDPLELQLQLQRFTDDFLSQTEQALDDYAQRVGTDVARAEALRLKLVSGSSLLSIVSGPNPSANLLDLVSVTVLTHRTIEDYWIKTPNGAAYQRWLDASRLLETNVWSLAARFLTPAQVEEVRQAVNDWYARTPEVRTAFFARPGEFASMLRASKEKGAELNGVFSLENLDPTIGLDPAVREITRSRLFAERAMFTMQRMPFLLRMQIELMGYQLGQQPAVQLALTNTIRLSDSADRISRASESISQTAAQLPDRLSAERKEIMTALEQQEGKLQALVAEVDRSLASGEKMSSSLNITITNFDVLMKRFGVGEPNTNAAPANTNARPFNISDYGQSAAQIGDMAKELNSLITSVHQSTPEVQQLTQQATANMTEVVNHGFRLGLVLIGVLLAGAVAAGLVFRFFSEKLTQRGPSTMPKR
jgi:hypothetical protein